MSKKKKDRFQISTDELEHRTKTKAEADRPAKSAVEITDEFLSEIMQRLGVDTTKDEESVQAQMSLLDIYVNSFEGIGIFITALKEGTLRPFAFIKEPEVSRTGEKFVYAPAYWNWAINDFTEPRRIKIA